jgi:integrase
MVDLKDRREIYSKAIEVHKENKKPKQSALRNLEDKTERTHSREFTLTRREFEEMVEATYELDSPYDLECRFVLFLAGKLGMRSAEISHIDSDWVNWQERVVEIPIHDECNKGTCEGEVCGSCRLMAKKKLRNNNLTIKEAKEAITYHYSEDKLQKISKSEFNEMVGELREEVNLTYQEVISECWSPKTENSARQIPFDFDIRIQMTLESFFDKYDMWDKSKSTINRRINRLKEKADISKRVFPHSLRATAASFHSARNISAHSLMSIMGWSDIGTARSYVNSNDEKAQKEIRSKYR